MRFVISPPLALAVFMFSTDVQETNPRASTCVTLTQAYLATSSALTESRRSVFV